MMNPYKNYYLMILLLSNIIILLPFVSNAQAGQNSSSVSAIYVFGDSTVDPGNNNFFPTIAKANFAPYGKDFPNHIPTGRFTNGLLISDFLARYFGVKDLVPPYLNKSLSIEELKSGVSFASAAAGFDPLTPKLSNAISLPKQLEYFKEYKAKMEESIGKEQTQLLLKNAIFLVSSAGANDFVLNYDGFVPIRRKNYTLPAYAHLVQQYVQHFLQELVDEGGKRIGVAGLPPLGCLPFVISLHSKKIATRISKRDCVDTFTPTNIDYNSLLQTQLKDMQRKYAKQDLRIAYLDIYGPILDMIQHPNNYGVVEVSKGCCGSGLAEISILCNAASPVCEDASKHVFWDSAHPTQTAYYATFKALQPTFDYLIAK